MLEEAEARLIDLASAVADGRSLDWNALESSTEDPDERAVIKRLRAIADVGRVHADISFHGPFTITESFGRTPDPPPVQPGETWGSLQILEKVGRGRFGDVYRAWDPSLDREVALKLLRRDDERAEDQLLVEEGRLMARVHHPHVVTIYGAQRIEGRTGLWMEFVRGRTLEAELRERGPFGATDIVTIGEELCRALTAVHEAGLVHRDVKAQNVLRDSRGHVLLGDFGTGRELDEEESGAQEIAGTPAYLAPEIFRQARATLPSDIYSLGALLFHLATGGYPVQGRSLRELRDAHARGERTWLRDLRPDFPKALAAAIDRALSPDASDRFPDAAAMERALSSSLAIGDHATTRSRRRLMLAAAAVMSLVITIALWVRVGPEVILSRLGAGPDSANALQPDLSDGRRVFRQISPDSNLAGPGVPSPDGRLLSYVDGAELALFDISTRRRWRVTGTDLSGDPRGWVVHSRFSLDGSRLTYLRFSSEHGPPRPEIRVVPVGGGQSRLVWRGDDEREIWLQHSAGEDTRILAAREAPHGESDFLVISTEHGTAQATAPVPIIGLTGASLSPDGRFIAYERPDPATGMPDIHVLSTDDGVDQPVIQDASPDRSPVWSRDGRQLFFVSSRSGTSALWAQAMVGARPEGRPVRIEPNLGWAYPMGGPTDTGALFFRRQIGTRDVYVVDVDPDTLALRGEPQRVRKEGVGANGSSAWSPDGRQLAFFRNLEGARWSLIVKSFADGTEQEFWKPRLEGIQRPRWESQRTVLFKAALEGRSGLYKLDLDTGAVATVMEGVFNEYELLPDPGVILYSVRSRREVIRRDIVTGQETVIHRVPPPSTLVEMGLSHRGDRLAYSSPIGGGKGWALRVVDLASPQKARELLTVGPDEFIGAYAWSLDDREIVIKRAKNATNPPAGAQRESDESRLWAVDAATGQSRLIGLNLDGLQQVRMSPDGRRLSFDGGWPFQEVWALEHAVTGVLHSGSNFGETHE